MWSNRANKLVLILLVAALLIILGGHLFLDLYH